MKNKMQKSAAFNQVDPDRVDIFRDMVLTTFDILSEQKDLSPNNEIVTRVLSAFVPAVTSNDTIFTKEEKGRLLQDRDIQNIRQPLLDILSRAEYEMELHFSNKFLAQGDQLDKSLKDFWYLDNYKALMDAEIDALHKGKASDHVYFVGSGPLPLSAIIMHHKTGAKITCVDIDPDAIDRSQKLIKNLGLEDKFNFVCANGDQVDYKDASVVLLASLVPNKRDVLKKIEQTSQKSPEIAVRTAYGLNTLLYQPVKRHDLKRQFNLRVKKRTQIDPHVINSTWVCKMAPKTPKF